MYTVVFESNKKTEVKVEHNEGTWKVNGKETSVDIHQINPQLFNLIIGGRSFNVEVLSNHSDSGSSTFKVNGTTVPAEIRTALDELLNKMGMNQSQLAAVKDIKAPMPGLILKVMASPGMTLKKGDPILILEAMKMENIIKSPVDGIVKKLNVKEKDSVSKNQVLIEF